VSVVPWNGALWANNILLRDLLRTHPEWCDRHATVKRRAAAAYPESLLAYQDDKRDFVEQMKSAAQTWADADLARSTGSIDSRR
jgi:GrpB-like predicted nucleotidyltransferase (UPF0157 family)